MKAIILARVSTQDQMDEGYSIPAQLLRAREYAQRKGLEIVSEYNFDESSLKDHRKKFDAVIEEIKKSNESIALIVETIDRLQRSFKESVLLDDYRKTGKLELHFIRENLIIHKESNSSELQRWDLGVFMARSFVLQISDNVKRSNEQRFRDGFWYGKAYVGYKNIVKEDGTKTIVIDKDRAFLVKKMFELYATGDYSMKKLMKEMNKRGLTNHPSGKPLTTSQVDRMLKNSFYYGVMNFKGRLAPHNYEPIISKFLFDQARKVSESYNKQPFKRTNKPYVFRGLIRCDKCGCALSPEIKKGKYIYYHCTNYHGNCDNVVWIKEEDLLREVGKAFRGLKLRQEEAERLKSKLRAINESEEAYFQENVDRINNRLKIIRARYKEMYIDKVDGCITTDMFDNLMEEHKKEEQDLLLQLEEYSNGNREFYITAVKLIDVASRAYSLLESSEPEEKTQLINFVLQNLRLKGRNLLFELKTPFNGILDYAKSGNLYRVWDSNP